jgi:hypothetical protein
MVNLFDKDSGFIDEETQVPLPLISVEFGESDAEPAKRRRDLSETQVPLDAPAGAGFIPRPDEQEEVPAGDPAFINAASNFYNLINRSPENQQKLADKQQKHQEIADQVGLTVKQLYQMAALGDERGDILKDMGFELYTPSDDLTRVTNFLWGEQQKYFNNRKAGKSHSELPFGQQLSAFFMPLDALDIIGLGFGIKKLVQLGLQKYAARAGSMSAADLLKDEELIAKLTYQEAQQVFDEFSKLRNANQDVLYKGGQGAGDFDFSTRFKSGPNKNQSKFEVTYGQKPLEFLEILAGTTDIRKNPEVLKRFASYYNEYMYALRPNDTTKKTVSRSGDRIKQFREFVGEEKADDIIQAASDEGLIKIRDVGGAKTVKAEGDEFIKQNYRNMEVDELLDIMQQTPENYFFTNSVGERLTFKTPQALNEHALRLGLKRKDVSSRLVTKKIIPIKEKFEELISSRNLDTENLALMRETFKEAITKVEGRTKDTMGEKFSDHVNRRIKAYNSLDDAQVIVPNQAEAVAFTGAGTSMRDTFFSYLRNNETSIDDIIANNPDFTRDKGTLYKFLDFARASSKDSRLPKEGKFDDFMKAFDADIQTLKDPSSTLSAHYNFFKEYEGVRETIGGLVNDYLNRIYLAPKTKKTGVVRSLDERIKDARNSVQIAHKYENLQSGRITQDTMTIAGKPVSTLEGSGVVPGSYYLDISIDNAIKQPRLEQKLRKAIDSGDESMIASVDQELKGIGAKVTYDGVTYGDYRPLEIKLQDELAKIEMLPEAQKAKVMQERGITQKMLDDMNQAIDLLNDKAKDIGVRHMSYGGMVEDDLDIFEEQSNDLPEGSYEVANLMLPFFKLLGKAPVNEVAPIPTPKEKLTNPTKKQTQSLETEKAKRAEEDIFDPTPNEPVELDPTMPVEVTPITQQPMTSVFYSDIERAMTNAPDQFANKQEVLDFLNKNRIKKSEVDDYRIASLLKLYDDTSPISKTEIISQVRTAPISGMKVHATGSGSEIINPNGEKSTRYSGYFEPGSIPDTQRERVLYINRDKLPGDTGDYPQSMFGGETIQRHDFGIPNEDNTYIVGWTRLSDRYGFVPPKVEGPQTKINVRQLTREKTKNEKSLKGLYAEAKNKIGRLANQRGMSAADQNDILLDFGGDNPKMSVIAKYADQLDEISPGLVDQMDELVVKNRELQEQLTKASAVDPSGVVRVTFADEIQSDLLQAAAARKQQLAAALRKIQEEGAEQTNLEGLNQLAKATLDFYEKNKSVFRPLKKTDAEINLMASKISKMDEEVDAIVDKYIETREVSDADLSRLSGLLNENLDNMLKEIIEIDSAAMDGLFPDLPFKNRDEWADALIKKDLYELAYRKFVLKDPDASGYYAISPSKYVSKRYNFEGNAATPQDVRDLDKAARLSTFKREGRFTESKFKGIGMDEFYGGPDSVSNVIDESGTKATNPNFGKPKHYTSTLETILKKQAQSNNSEVITMPVQLKGGKGTAYFKITDQNDNMVATLTNGDQARELLITNPNYKVETISVPNKASMEPVFAIKITPEMLEPYKTHKAQGGLVEHIDIFEV